MCSLAQGVMERTIKKPNHMMEDPGRSRVNAWLLFPGGCHVLAQGFLTCARFFTTPFNFREARLIFLFGSFGRIRTAHFAGA
jgi:hypothetical protein